MTTVLQQTAVRPLQQQVQAPQPQQVSNQQPSHKSHGHHHHRQLYKTVCADCSKECEVPFKPTGERPIYCKECFSKRKSSKKQPVTQPHHKTSPMHERQIKVIPKGLGRVTISEMVPVSGTKSKPAKKSRRRR
ncbi:MAG: hypothetical protein H6757_00355 [Candidatus Omnitrophica bacterium]|nr:hypothetical protein [Candidatus Omnitrophota bacterium]